MSRLESIANVKAPVSGTPISKLYSDELDRDEVEHLVASNLGRLRALRHLSLDGLARLSGVSRAMLGQIESGRSIPSIRVLHRIAAALGVSVSAFLRDFALSGVELLPKQAAQRVVSASGNFSSRNLLPAQRHPRFEFHEVRLAAGATEHLNARSPGTYKNLVLTQGVLEVDAKGQIALLGQDDAIFFDADHPHSYRNAGDIEVLAYVVTHHPETRHL